MTYLCDMLAYTLCVHTCGKYVAHMWRAYGKYVCGTHAEGEWVVVQYYISYPTPTQHVYPHSIFIALYDHELLSLG